MGVVKEPCRPVKGFDARTKEVVRTVSRTSRAKKHGICEALEVTRGSNDLINVVPSWV